MTYDTGESVFYTYDAAGNLLRIDIGAGPPEYGVSGYIRDEGGNPLADALAKHPLHFDDLVVNLVRAGEQAGVLETLLDKIATYKEKTEALKGKIKKAMIYPAAVIVVAFVVTAILLIFVVPQFEDLFSSD